MADLNIGEIAATTLRNRSGKMADNISNGNALLTRMTEKGTAFRSANGGRSIVEELMYAENTNAKWYDGYDTWTINPDDSLDAAEFDWKQLGGFATFSGLDQIKNSGKHAIINLVKARIKVLDITLKNKAATAIYGDGTGSGGKEFGGLQLLVADDPTAVGTVGGIAQNTNAFWRNQVAAAAATTKDNIQSRMNAMYLATCRGTDKTDLTLADATMFTHYEESLQQIQRVTSSKMADAGYNSLKYKGSDVVYDDQCPTKHMYMLNTDHLHLRCHPDRKFATGKTRTITNGDHQVVPVFLAGNLTCSNRSLQGVIIAS